MSRHEGAGRRPNGHAQVVDLDEKSIPGLYAAGNVAAAVFDTAYSGSGWTIGAGVTFGTGQCLNVGAGVSANSPLGTHLDHAETTRLRHAESAI